MSFEHRGLGKGNKADVDKTSIKIKDALKTN